MRIEILRGMLTALFIAPLLITAFFLGAWLHEGDIQRACKEKGFAEYAAWRGDLMCSPKPDSGRQK